MIKIIKIIIKDHQDFPDRFLPDIYKTDDL